MKKVVFFSYGIPQYAQRIQSWYDKCTKYLFESLLEVCIIGVHFEIQWRAHARVKFRKICTFSTNCWKTSNSKLCSTGGSTGRHKARMSKYTPSAFICTPNHSHSSHDHVSSSTLIPLISSYI